MPCDFEIESHPGYLKMTISGSLESVEDLNFLSKAVVSYASEYAHKRLLIDMRPTRLAVDQYDSITYADKWVINNPPGGLKIASIFTEAEAEEYHWVETIYHNRSITYRIFNSAEIALQWLASSDGNAKESSGQIDYAYAVKGDILHIMAIGSLNSTQEMVAHVKTMHEELARTNLSKMLVDETRCHIHMKFDDLKDAARIAYQQKWFSKSARIAGVASNLNQPLYKYIFNLLERVKAFDNEKEAHDWLSTDE